MSAFHNYYLLTVEEGLGRSITPDETVTALTLYLVGWHPQRVVEYLQRNAELLASLADSSTEQPT